MSKHAKLLRELAVEDGIARATLLGEAADVPASTACRMWNQEVTDISSGNLFKLARVLPSVGDYLVLQGGLAIQDALLRLETREVPVNREAIRSFLKEGSKPAHLATAFDVATRIAFAPDDDALQECVPRVALCWERNRGRCFEAIMLGPADHRLAAIPGLEDRAARLLTLVGEERERRGNHEFVDSTRQVLIHYLAQAGDQHDELIARATASAGPLDHRCEATGRMIRMDDQEAAERYAREVNDNGHAARIEKWMFPAWTGDVPLGQQASVDLRIPLKHTGAEVREEIARDKYPSAYLWYLSSVYLPMAAEVDPTIGGHAPAICAALNKRVEKGTLTSEAESAAVYASRLLAAA